MTIYIVFDHLINKKIYVAFLKTLNNQLYTFSLRGRAPLKVTGNTERQGVSRTSDVSGGGIGWESEGGR